MVAMLVRIEALEAVVLTVLEHLRNGKIEDTIASFAEEFSFKDHGVDLDSTTKSAWRSSSERHGHCTQTLCCRLTQSS
jgi:hypothetical protein